MKIAQHARPASARRAMRIDQGLRVNFEMAIRRRMDIGAGARLLDPSGLAQQNAAGFARMLPSRAAPHLVGRSPCHAQLHSHLSSMGDGEIITGVLATNGERLDKALADATGLSRERVKALIADGRVTLAGAVAKSASAKPAAGTPYAMDLPAIAAAQAQPQDIPLAVVFEDDHLIVVDKPAGLVVHPAAGNPNGTLVNALLHHCRGCLSGINGVARPGIVHRIDKDTSGLMVAAKSDAAHEGLARQFADHSIARAYLAVVNGVPMPPAGTVRGRIGRSDANRKKMAVLPDTSTRGKHAVTHYRLLEPFTGAALVECRLETGRTHQVRVHMASIGHALLGDPLYGRVNPRIRPILSHSAFARQALHAAELGFMHPISGETLEFRSEMPADMREILEKIAAL